MRSYLRLLCFSVMAISLVLSPYIVQAADYEPRFMKNYPPGYYGMWYYADRFYSKSGVDSPQGPGYRWDKFMSGITNLSFPYYPIPYDWDYGTGRTFNLPDYNANNWPD